MGAEAQVSRPSRFEQLFGRLLPFLLRWTRGRLPTYARRRLDTGDLVQEAIVAALRRRAELDRLPEDELRRYLQTAILNRIRDEIRRAGLGEVTNAEPAGRCDARPSPLDEAIDTEERRRYRAALLGLSQDDRVLLVGRVELSLSYEELALVSRRPTPEAARAATRRALGRLAQALGAADGPAAARPA